MLFCKTCCILWGIAVHGNHNRRLSKSRFTNQPVRKYQERLDKTCFFSNSVDKYIGLQSAMELSSPMAEPKSNGLRQNPIVWQGFRYDMKFFNFAVLYRKHLKNVLPFNYLFSLAKPDKKSTGVNSIPVFPHFVKNVNLGTACYFHRVKFELLVQRYPWRRHNVTSSSDFGVCIVNIPSQFGTDHCTFGSYRYICIHLPSIHISPLYPALQPLKQEPLIW